MWCVVLVFVYDFLDLFECCFGIDEEYCYVDDVVECVVGCVQYCIQVVECMVYLCVQFWFG